MTSLETATRVEPVTEVSQLSHQESRVAHHADTFKDVTSRTTVVRLGSIFRALVALPHLAGSLE
jgi:hypothetical protein